MTFTAPRTWSGEDPARATLDPRWDWNELRTLGSANVEYVRGPCNHLEAVPVESGGETVAHLCLTCDVQLPAEWRA